VKEGKTMKILVGYDGTNAAKAAVEVAKTFALDLGAEIIVITSIKSAIEAKPEGIAEAESALDHTKSVLEEAGVACQTNLLIQGLSPGESLVTYAKHSRCDHIVIGVQRRSRVSKLVMGSTVQYVILNAHCPVTSVK
jgi:nucleotide-binding universal stress UspA family protein